MMVKCILRIHVILLLYFVIFFESVAQTGSKDYVFRSGITFHGYSEDMTFSLSSSIDPENLDLLSQKEFTYYLTPGFGKYMGRGYYLGVQAIVGKSEFESQFYNYDHELIGAANSQSDRIGAGVLFRKYYSLTDRFSPFFGVSSNFYSEEGDVVSYSGESFSLTTTYFSTEFHVGVNFLVVPRLEVETYYSPGRFYGRKNKNYEGEYDFETEFGKRGQEFSLGINYHIFRGKE